MLALLFLPVLYLAIMALYDALNPVKQKEKTLTDADITPEMQAELIDKFNLGIAYKMGNKTPLYGWAYMWKYQDFKPPLEMSVAMTGERYTFKSFNGEPDLMIQAIRAIKTGIKKERAAAKRKVKLEKQYLKYVPVYIPATQEVRLLELVTA
jgi:hypothetical protein